MCEKLNIEKPLKLNQSTKGFTLVELAVVIFLIAIITGGILQGAKMLENARVLREIKNIESYRTATNMFQQTYKQLPGDLEDADLKIPECGPSCKIIYEDMSYSLPNMGVAEDGAVGQPNWSFLEFQYYGFNNNQPDTNLYGSSDIGTAGDFYQACFAETILFWYEMELTGFLKGVVTNAGVKSNYDKDGFGEILPAMSLGGGFWVGYSNGVNAQGQYLGRTSSQYPKLGNVIMAVSKFRPEYDYIGMFDPGYVFATKGLQPFTPHIAAQIDRKIDDGLPATGIIHAYGYEPSCYGDNLQYQEGVDSKDCGLIISIYR